MATTSKPSSIADNEAGIARRLWLKFRKDSIIALYTPFVVCLASGNLRLDTFRHYIAQDAHFLKAFAQASVLSYPILYNTIQALFLIIIIIIVSGLFQGLCLFGCSEFFSSDGICFLGTNWPKSVRMMMMLRLE